MDYTSLVEKTYTVEVTRKTERGFQKLDVRVLEALITLVQDLQDNGPMQPRWPNFSKLSENTYHCHLKYSYVACWRTHGRHKDKIELYYVGSREKAPY